MSRKDRKLLMVGSAVLVVMLIAMFLLASGGSDWRF